MLLSLKIFKFFSLSIPKDDVHYPTECYHKCDEKMSYHARVKIVCYETGYDLIEISYL